jgi:hypothetical protein
VFVGVVEQNAAGDVPCLEVDDTKGCPRSDALPLAEGQLPTLCQWGSHVSLYKQHAMDATGPTFARHVGDRLYMGEYFVLQTDADVVAQFDAAANDMAVLSTYPTEVEGALDRLGRSTHTTTPVMCATGFTGEVAM